LPVRAIRYPVPAPPRRLWNAALPWYPSGPPGQPFDFCGHVSRVCSDIAARCPALRHIDVGRLLFAVTQARNSRAHGLQARVTPLRFPGGHLTRRRRGITEHVQRYLVDGHEFFYLVTFCLPRFLDQSFEEKVLTLFHELHHISPAFDGDLRRYPGRYALHSRSQRAYDYTHMAQLADAYLDAHEDRALHGFLRLDFGQLHARHGSVVGVVVPWPKVVPVPGNGLAG
jgi:predicted metallopeptidase